MKKFVYVQSIFNIELKEKRIRPQNILKIVAKERRDTRLSRAFLGAALRV